MQNVPREKNRREFSLGSARGTFLALGVGALVGASLVWWFGNGAGRQGVIVTIEAPEKAMVGEPFDAKVTIANQSPGEARAVKAALDLPRGLAFADRAAESRRSVTIGDLPADREESRTFQLVAVSGSEAPLSLKTEISYIPFGLNKPFATMKEAEVRVISPVEIEIELPEKIVSGELFMWRLNLKNVSEKAVEAELSLGAPQGFETSFKPTKIALASDEEKLGEFTGTVAGAGESSPLVVKAVAVRDKREYALGTREAVLSVAPSALELEAKINDGKEIALRAGEAFTFNIRIANRGAEPIRNLSVRSALKSKMLDWARLASEGSIEGASVTWNASRMPKLNELAPGEEVFLSFSAGVRGDFPVARLGDRNFTLEIETRAEGVKTVEEKDRSATALARSTAKIAGAVRLETKALFRDADSGVVNGGPFPPRVGEPTEVSVHWKIASPATDVKEIEARARLPNSSSLGEARRAAVGALSFDEASREVVWKIPRLLATTGVLNAPVEAVFQLRFVPAKESVGTFAPILEASRATATDEFTGETLSVSGAEVTTLLKDDPTLTPDDGRVRR